MSDRIPEPSIPMEGIEGINYWYSKLISRTVIYSTDDELFHGRVIVVFMKFRSEKIRCVVGNADGILHIYNPSSLRIIPR